jgi:hypothetical protein
MDNQELRKKIEELEDFQQDCYLVLERKILNALKSGKSSESVFVDFSVMKERYLEALRMYRRLDLTPRSYIRKEEYGYGGLARTLAPAGLRRALCF